MHLCILFSDDYPNTPYFENNQDKLEYETKLQITIWSPDFEKNEK